MLLCSIKPGILGTAGDNDLMLRNSWCIAKLMRLFPGWTGPSDEDEVRQCEFKLAKRLSESLEPALEEISFLEDKMQKMSILPELKDLLRCMLIVDPDQRPSAVEVLASKEFRALVERLFVGLD